MKLFKSYLAFAIILSLMFAGCSKEDQSVPTSEPNAEMAQLSFGAILDNLANRGMNNDMTKDHFDQIPTCNDEAVPAVAQVTVSYGDVEVTVDLDILSDDDGNFFTDYSDELEIPVDVSDDGDDSNDFTTVTLSKFLVYDGDPDDGGTLIWVAPTGDGDFTGYVNNPLPLDIIVRPGVKKYVEVEVLCFDRRMVNQYGYLFFDIIPEKIYPLCFFANYCDDDGRHYPGNYGVDLSVLVDDQGNRISIYEADDTMPDVGNYGTDEDPEYYADPLCLVVPGPPEGVGDDEPYLFYTVTPKDWDAAYGDIDNTPLAEVGLSWNDVNGLLNDDGETNEYEHLFINCEGETTCIPGTPTEGDLDGDCLPNGDDPCPNDPNNECEPECVPGTPTEGDSDGDCLPNGDDPCPNNPNNDCDQGEECDGDETAFMQGDFRFSELEDGPNRWGWIEDFAIDSENGSSYAIYAGASNQYNLNESTNIGDVDISFDDVNNMVTLTFNFDNSSNGFSELHVNISDNIPPKQTLQAPGQYNNSAGAIGDGDSVSFPWNGEGDFYIVMHGADACKDGN